MKVLYLYCIYLKFDFPGVVAVMMRQTNIVWVGFLCVLTAIDVLGARVLKGPINTIADAKVTS